MDGGWPFIGRRQELDRLRELLIVRADAITDGSYSSVGRVCVVTGPAGVGKTRLLHEVVAAAEDAGHSTEVIMASAGTASIPYGAVSHLLPDPATELPPPDPGGSSTTSALVLRYLVGALLTRSPDGVVVAVDDAHLLDDASATLIRRVANSSRASVLLTRRDGERCPLALAELVDGDGIYDVRLSPFDRATTERLAAAALDGPLDIRFAVALWNVSRGNPLVLRQAILAAREQDFLRRGRHGWRLRSSGADLEGEQAEAAAGTRGSGTGVVVPAAVTARVAGLTGDERLVVEAVALYEPLEVDLVMALAAAAAIERLELAGLLLAVPDTHPAGRRESFRLPHPMFGQALRQQMAVARRRRLAGRLAELFAERGGRRAGDVLRHASWMLSAGARGDPEVLLSAATRATALGDPVAGERFARAAHGIGGGARALLAVGEALQTQARAVEAERWLARSWTAVGLPCTNGHDDRALTVAEGPTDRTMTARAAAVRAMNLRWGLGRVEEAHDLLAEAEHHVPDVDARSTLLAIRSASLVFLERYAEALDVATAVMERDEAGLSARVMAECPAQIVWAVTCRYRQVIASAERLAPLLGHVRDAIPLAPLMVESMRLWALLGFGRTVAAADGSRAQIDSALEQGNLAHAGYWAFHHGRTLMIAGRLGEARHALREATRLFEHGTLFGHDTSAYACLAQTAALVGDTATARSALEEADRRSDDRNRAWQGATTIARSWVYAAEGDLAEARRLAKAAAGAERATGNHEREAEALDLLGRLGRPCDGIDRLAVIAADAEGRVVPALAEVAAASCAGDADRLADAGSELASLGYALHAADAYARAALILHRRAQLQQCAQLTRRAMSLYEACSGARTPSRDALEAIDPAAALSPREAQVCRLALEPDTTNKKIAARLGVAERTVANHLARAYRKLGVAGRDDLSPVLSGTPNT